MKRRWWGVTAFVFATLLACPAGALDTVPSVPARVAGPLLITGYSFSGSNLRYVQIYNNSSSLVALDGWKVASATKTTPVVSSSYVTLSGLLEPGDHIIAAVPGLVDRSTYALPSHPVNSSSLVGTVSLVAPLASPFNDESVAVPTISSSTLKETDGSSSNYYLRRDVSASTGNYVSGFTFILPFEPLKNDQLYTLPAEPSLRVVELYPDAPACPPFGAAGLCTDYVKLHNTSAESVDLSQYRLRTGTYGQSSTTGNTRQLSGVLSTGRYASFPITLNSSASWVWLEDTYGTIVYEKTLTGYPSSSGNDGEAWSYDDLTGGWNWTPMPTPADAPNTFPVIPAVNPCSGLRLSEVAANAAAEEQFIELHNPTSSSIDLKGCALQTNRSTSATYVFGEEWLAPDNYVAVYIKDTSLTLTKTTSGVVYVLSSDLGSEVDSAGYDDLDEASSYSMIDGEWLQTFMVTPNSMNVWKQYRDCAVGYARNLDTGNCNKLAQTTSSLDDCGPGKYRSPDTNRCRSLEALATALTPCDEGQYRNPDTNRCRSLASTASVLTPCGPGQERNPDTNRCRSASADSGLQPCAANQERNPDTNRCRNVTLGTTADFPVEAVAQSSQATLGWWAFGGVGLLAAAYASWEWRHELSAAIRRVGVFAKLGR